MPQENNEKKDPENYDLPKVFSKSEIGLIKSILKRNEKNRFILCICLLILALLTVLFSISLRGETIFIFVGCTYIFIYAMYMNMKEKIIIKKFARLLIDG